MRRIFVLIFPIVILCSGAVAQSYTDSTRLSSFRKGRSMVGLNGSISSSYLSNVSIGTDNSQLGNLYRFDVKLGKFVASKNMVGLVFSASRTQMIGYVNNIAEILGVGPWYRLYLGKEPNIAFFLQADIVYSNYYGQSVGTQALFTIDEDIDMAGVRGSMGLGLSYVMADRVAFDVAFDYNLSRYWGVLKDNNLNTQQDIVLDRGGFVFSFGFYVLFKQLKQSDD